MASRDRAASGLARLLLTGLLTAAGGAGCAYTAGTGIPSHIRSGAVPTLASISEQFTLIQGRTQAVIDRFTRDNHLRIVPQREAQSLIEGTVLEYRNEVFGFTAGQQAQEYRVGLRVEVR